MCGGIFKDLKVCFNKLYFLVGFVSVFFVMLKVLLVIDKKSIFFRGGELRKDSLFLFIIKCRKKIIR